MLQINLNLTTDMSRDFLARDSYRLSDNYSNAQHCHCKLEDGGSKNAFYSIIHYLKHLKPKSNYWHCFLLLFMRVLANQSLCIETFQTFRPLLRGRAYHKS